MPALRRVAAQPWANRIAFLDEIVNHLKECGSMAIELLYELPLTTSARRAWMGEN